MSADGKKSDRATAAVRPRHACRARGFALTSASQKTGKANCPEPVDVVNGVPDRSGNPRLWKYLVIAAVFLIWICFLVLCGIIGAL